MRHLSELETLTITQVLEQLRTAKAASGLSCKRIVEMTEEKGMAVSDRTIRKVFSPTTDVSSFRLTTLFAIACALGVELINQEANEDVAREISELENKAASAEERAAAQEQTIAALTRQVESMRVTIRGNEDHLRERDRQIRALNEEIQTHVRSLRRKDKFLNLYTMSCLAASLTLAAFFASGTLAFRQR